MWSQDCACEWCAAVALNTGCCDVQVGAQTETELKEKKLRVEDALNATKVNWQPIAARLEVTRSLPV